MNGFYNANGTMNWSAIGTTVAVIGLGVVAGSVIQGQLAKTDIGKKLLGA